MWHIVENWKEQGLRTAAKAGEDDEAGGLPLPAVAGGDEVNVARPDEILMSATNISEPTWAQRREQLRQIVEYCKINASRRGEEGGNDAAARQPPTAGAVRTNKKSSATSVAADDEVEGTEDCHGVGEQLECPLAVASVGATTDEEVRKRMWPEASWVLRRREEGSMPEESPREELGKKQPTIEEEGGDTSLLTNSVSPMEDLDGPKAELVRVFCGPTLGPRKKEYEGVQEANGLQK
ncbi:unnamed protein product [Linum trigynum]